LDRRIKSLLLVILHNHQKIYEKPKPLTTGSLRRARGEKFMSGAW